MKNKNIYYNYKAIRTKHTQIKLNLKIILISRKKYFIIKLETYQYKTIIFKTKCINKNQIYKNLRHQ